MIKLSQIPKQNVSDVWHVIADWVHSSLGIDKSYSIDDVRNACESGSITLWIITKDSVPTGFLITTFNRTPQGVTCYAPWLGGENLGDWVAEGFEQLKIWLRENGCIQFTWIGRKAWQKLVKADSEQSFYLIKL